MDPEKSAIAGSRSTPAGVRVPVLVVPIGSVQGEEARMKDFRVTDDCGKTVRVGFVAIPTGPDGEPLDGAPCVAHETLEEAEKLAMEWVDRAALLGHESGAVVFELPGFAVVYEARAKRIRPTRLM